LHLDVLKDTKLIQKLMIDEKKCYLFGRNPHMTDFVVDHGSCSRVHASLVWHKHLERSFLVDLGSTHGTFIGNFRLDANKPTQLPVDSTFRFGESTRRYVIRERPQNKHRPIMDELEKTGSEADGGLLGLPETENELDNLTEFNTAQNRRISMMGIPKEETFVKKRRKIHITFNEEEDVINPEDVDPSIGRFRNMVQSTVIPKASKQQSQGFGLGVAPTSEHKHQRVSSHAGQEEHQHHQHSQGLYDEEEEESGIFSTTLSSSLGLSLPNPAPEIDMGLKNNIGTLDNHGQKRSIGEIVDMDEPTVPRKKKYAKEAWPGRKPGPSQGLF
jgi:nuclear inhibitor of protein phosphatase 1